MNLVVVVGYSWEARPLHFGEPPYIADDFLATGPGPLGPDLAVIPLC